MRKQMLDGLVAKDLEKVCALEPIHLLGTVQAYGFLMVVDIASGFVVQISEGIVRHWPGLQNPGALIGEPVSDWVDFSDQAGAFNADGLPEAGPVAMPWRLRFESTALIAPQPDVQGWECLAHQRGGLAMLEWLPVASFSDKPARENQMFADFGKVVSHLRHAPTLALFFDECAKLVQEFTAFDRVLLYRFLPDGAGEVVAERVSRDTEPAFLGLRFPASDIPAQARQLYLTNKLRVVADAREPLDQLLPRILPGGALLDQSHCMLRGPSEVHLAYLHNMGVRATLTVSIICDDKLWGLIACHNRAPKTPPHQVRESLRQICELLGEITNMRIESLLSMDAMTYRLALDHLLHEFHQALIQGSDVASVLDAWSPRLLEAFRTTNFGVRIGRLAYFVGRAGQHRSASTVLDEIGARLHCDTETPHVHLWDALRESAPGTLVSLPEAAGLMLAQRSDQGLIFACMCRPEHLHEVRWGGKPVKEDVMALPDGTVRLSPRRSFAEWQQLVRGHAIPWTQVEGDALQNLLRILSDVEKLHLNRRLQQTLHWRAHHDHLTGLHNRQAMEDEVTHLLKEGPCQWAMMLLDLDHFKNINDTYGHEVGDQILQQLALRLQAVTRESDLLSRLGGDEFLVLLSIPQPAAANSLLASERLHEAIAPPFVVGEQQLRLGISVGIAIPPQHGNTLSELLRHADLALYQAKSRGRSRSAVFELTMASDHLDYFLLERDLAEALERNEMTLVYQPKVDLLSHRVVGLEALLRWNHPARGQSSPDTFIAIAERSDQIVHIDRWVMQSAIAESARWQANGLAPLPIAINLSIADILSPNLTDYLGELLNTYHVLPAALEIEVTESCIMRQLEQTQAVLKSLNDSGIATSLDDFGTGFSSLSYLRQLPLQSLKIDKSFTQNILTDENAEKLTQAIIAMGIALNMKVIAEGVETCDQMHWLVAHGCHIGQGFFFSPPVAPDDVQRVVERLEANLG
jgi:diguanylate cyclase (GGDEF)-like protein